VPVLRVMLEKDFDFLCQFCQCRVLSRTVNVIKHGNRPQLVDSPQFSKKGEFLMSKLHFFFNTQSETFNKRLKISGDFFLKNLFNKSEIMDFRVPDEKLLDSFAGKGTDGINVCRAAVVLSEISSEHIVEMERGQLDQVAFAIVFLKGQL
jgi:hypothetical protein